MPTCCISPRQIPVSLKDFTGAIVYWNEIGRILGLAATNFSNNPPETVLVLLL